MTPEAAARPASGLDDRRARRAAALVTRLQSAEASLTRRAGRGPYSRQAMAVVKGSANA
jgi:hypothetical protein